MKITGITNVLTGVGKKAPVLENQEVQRGPEKVSAPVAGVGTPSAQTVADDRARRAAENLRNEVDLERGVGRLFNGEA